MIKITYRSSSEGSPIKIIFADAVIEGIAHFQAWLDGQCIFIGATNRVVSEEDIDEDEYLVTRAEGQGD